jgi:hypothetical protein
MNIKVSNFLPEHGHNRAISLQPGKAKTYIKSTLVARYFSFYPAFKRSGSTTYEDP